MGVNIIRLANGETLIDMSPATATADKILENYTAFGADGNLIRGTASANNFYATGRKITITLPASNWTGSGEVYAQSVSANVSDSDKGIAQLLLSDDLNTRVAEIEADENLTKVDLRNGYVQVETSEPPEIALTLEIAIINGLAASSKAAVMCLNGKQLEFTLSKDAWTQAGEVYTQSVAVDGLTDDITFGELLINDDDSEAKKEIAESRNVGKFEIANGNITAFAFGYPPALDLHYFITTFNKE